MSDASQIAAQEGVDASDVEVVSVQEYRVDEHTVRREITYRITTRATKAAVDAFINNHGISDARATSAFYRHLNSTLAAMPNASSNHMQRLNSAMHSALQMVSSENIPISAPTWYTQIDWSQSYSLAEFHPSLVPSQRSGCYVFSGWGSILMPSVNVLYVGRAADLRSRLRTYFNHIRNGKPTKHPGAYLLGGFAAEHGADKVFVSWVALAQYRDREGDLQSYLMPHFCLRDEIASLEDTDSLDDVSE